MTNNFDNDAVTIPHSAFGQSTLWTVPTTPQGWQCPVCWHVYSPSTVECLHCPPVATTRATYTPHATMARCNYCGMDMTTDHRCTAGDTP